MSALDTQIDRRIAELRADAESFLQRFDANSDGVIDALELQAARAVVAHEILSGVESTNETQIINDRFEFLSELGHGAQGVTHLARDRQTSELVAVKVLSLKTAMQWKALDLFHREVEALRRLSHPQIPAFVDAFDHDETEFFLVQTFVPGDNLMVRLARQELINEERLKDIAEQLLEVLCYLHQQSPPLLHRDVKPANIIIGMDGAVSLVDFGAVQNQGSRGTTIVGTSGYMPPEQLTGRAVPASDVYAVGALLVHAATRVHPADLELLDLKLQWRSRAGLADAFADWIDRLIEPVVEDRPAHAGEALRLLRALDEAPVTAVAAPLHSTALAHPPTRTSPDGRVVITADNHGLTMVVSRRSRPVIGWGAVAAAVGVGVLVALQTGQVFVGLVVFTALAVPIAFVTLYLLFTSRTRTLKLSASGAETYVDGKLKETARIREINGPAIGRHRDDSEDLLLEKKNGQNIVLATRISVADAKWATHEIRKYLTGVRP